MRTTPTRGQRSRWRQGTLWRWSPLIAGSLVFCVIAIAEPLQSPMTNVTIDPKVSARNTGLLNEERGINFEEELAWTKFLNGSLEKAEFLFKKLANKRSLSPRETMALAMTLLDKKDFEGAHFWSIQGVQGSWRALAYFIDGRALEALGRAPEAIAAYGKALEADSLFTEARPFRAKLLESRGAIDRAWKDYDRVLSVDSRNARAVLEKSRLEPRLTKAPSELIPRKKIISPHPIRLLPTDEGGPLLRVGVGTDARGRLMPLKSVSFQCSGPFKWVDDASRPSPLLGGANDMWTITTLPDGILVKGPNGDKTFTHFPIRVEPEQEGQTFIFQDVPFGTGFSWSGLADREYRGAVEIRLDPDGLRLINLVSLEAYLYGVLPAEMPSRFPEEALKAQAVLARSYALFQRNIRKPHQALGYDICDEQHCQVYGGVALEDPQTAKAIDATRGQFLTYSGQPVHAVYSSNCGGHSQSGDEIGWGHVSYWKGSSDRSDNKESGDTKTYFCGPSVYTEGVKSEWVRIAFVEDVLEKVRRKKDMGTIDSLKISQQGPSGRAIELTIQGSCRTWVIRDESEIRRVLGIAPLRSTLFTVETVSRNHRPAYFLIQGRGWGHGVGFCQSGGAGRAQTGQTFNEILEHYFPGTHIEEINRRES